MRQAVWDVTEYVRTAGAGSYTVADIMFERAGAYLPYAAWTIVAAYELDPAVDLAGVSPEQRARFALRAVTWDDGFATLSDGRVDVVVDRFVVPAGAAVFAKTFHLAVNPRPRSAESLLFAGQPLGNNASPGNAPAPAGVFIGTDPACNSTTDVVNDSICVLGTPVATKTPGADGYVAATDGRTPSSGVGRRLRRDAGARPVPRRRGDVRVAVARRVGPAPVAVGLLAASVDLPTVAPEVVP